MYELIIQCQYKKIGDVKGMCQCTSALKIYIELIIRSRSRSIHHPQTRQLNQNKENIIHYHVQSPVRVLSYVYDSDEVKVNLDDFKVWLSKSFLHNKRKSILTQKKNKDEWLEKCKTNPGFLVFDITSFFIFFSLFCSLFYIRLISSHVFCFHMLFSHL